MIACPVCGKPNESFAATCVACGSFLQSRVDTLDLFTTAWGLLESPRRTFRRIVMARNKNYVLVLSALFGIALIYGTIWYRTLGARIDSAAVLLLAGPVLGPAVGILVVALFAACAMQIGRVLGGKGGFRNLRAVAAYATVPVLLAFVLVFPAELAVFGMDLFRKNPHPMVINPIAYLTFIGIDTASVIWSWLLLVEGTVIAEGFARGRAFLMVFLLLLISGACVGLVSLV